MPRRKKRKLHRHSITEKLAVVRRFNTFDSKNRDKNWKRRLQYHFKKWEGKRLWTLVPATPTQRRQARAQGMTTTNKGIVSAAARTVAGAVQPGVTRKAGKKGMITTRRRKKGVKKGRVDYQIPLSATDKMVLARWGADKLMSRLKKRYPKLKRFAFKSVRQQIILTYGGGRGKKIYGSPEVLDDKVASGGSKFTKPIKGIIFSEVGL